MLWLSDDDGDPPWWMWLLMVMITFATGWHFFSVTGREWPLQPLSRLAGVPMGACLCWFAVRFVFWFDKS